MLLLLLSLQINTLLDKYHDLILTSINIIMYIYGFSPIYILVNYFPSGISIMSLQNTAIFLKSLRHSNGSPFFL